MCATSGLHRQWRKYILHWFMCQQVTPIDMQNKPQAKIKAHVSIKIASIRLELGMSAQGAKETWLSGTQEKRRGIL